MSEQMLVVLLVGLLVVVVRCVRRRPQRIEPPVPVIAPRCLERIPASPPCVEEPEQPAVDEPDGSEPAVQFPTAEPVLSLRAIVLQQAEAYVPKALRNLDKYRAGYDRAPARWSERFNELVEALTHLPDGLVRRRSVSQLVEHCLGSGYTSDTDLSHAEAASALLPKKQRQSLYRNALKRLVGVESCFTTQTSVAVVKRLCELAGRGLQASERRRIRAARLSCGQGWCNSNDECLGGPPTEAEVTALYKGATEANIETILPLAIRLAKYLPDERRRPLLDQAFHLYLRPEKMRQDIATSCGIQSSVRSVVAGLDEAIRPEVVEALLSHPVGREFFHYREVSCGESIGTPMWSLLPPGALRTEIGEQSLANAIARGRLSHASQCSQQLGRTLTSAEAEAAKEALQSVDDAWSLMSYVGKGLLTLSASDMAKLRWAVLKKGEPSLAQDFANLRGRDLTAREIGVVAKHYLARTSGEDVNIWGYKALMALALLLPPKNQLRKRLLSRCATFFKREEAWVWVQYMPEWLKACAIV